MSKSRKQDASVVRRFVRDLERLYAIPKSKKYSRFELTDAAFDRELLASSPVYRRSRRLYLSIGGGFRARVCSTTRSLSSQDLFKSEIEFSPLRSELQWFAESSHELAEPRTSMEALVAFNEVSIFHEQNHRIVWQLLPTAPKERGDFCRYLNFAESVIVALDMALGDELGAMSEPFERMRAVYQPSGNDGWHRRGGLVYRDYLLGVLAATYFLLELKRPADILNAVNYLFPGRKGMMKAAVTRALDLNPLFTLNTNRLWQERNWKRARTSLAKLHAKKAEPELCMPEDPLDLDEEFVLAAQLLEQFGL